MRKNCKTQELLFMRAEGRVKCNGKGVREESEKKSQINQPHTSNQHVMNHINI